MGLHQIRKGVNLENGDRIGVRFSSCQLQEPLDDFLGPMSGSEARHRIGLRGDLPRLEAGEPALDAHYQLGRDERLPDIIIRA